MDSRCRWETRFRAKRQPRTLERQAGRLMTKHANHLPQPKITKRSPYRNVKKTDVAGSQIEGGKNKKANCQAATTPEIHLIRSRLRTAPLNIRYKSSRISVSPHQMPVLPGIHSPVERIPRLATSSLVALVSRRKRTRQPIGDQCQRHPDWARKARPVPC